MYRAAVYYCFDPVYVAAALVGGGDGTGSGSSRVFMLAERGCVAGGGLLAGRWGVGVRWGHGAHIFQYFICRRGNGPG